MSHQAQVLRVLALQAHTDELFARTLLVERFGPHNQRAVSTIISASREPVLLNDLIAEYQTLGPELRRGGPQDSAGSV